MPATGCVGSAARSGSTARTATSATSRIFDADQRAQLYSDEYRAALAGNGVAAEAIAGPWREASGHDRARRPARGRRPHLPARRPADQDRHRDDGALAGGALAVPRSRADAVRRLDPGADEAARDGEEGHPARCPARLVAGLDPRPPQAGLLGPAGGVAARRAARLLPRAAARPGFALARSASAPARSRSCSTPTRAGAEPLAPDLGAD